MSGQFALFAGDFLQLQEDRLPIEIVSAALGRIMYKNRDSLEPDWRLTMPDLASVAVIMIFPPLTGDQGRPPAPAGDDGLLAPGAPGRHVSGN